MNEKQLKIARILHEMKKGALPECVNHDGLGYVIENEWDALPDAIKHVQADWIMQRYEIRESCNDGADGGKSRVRARVYKKQIAELEEKLNASCHTYEVEIEFDVDVDNFRRIFKERAATLIGQKVTAKTAKDLHRIANECLKASFHIALR